MEVQKNKLENVRDITSSPSTHTWLLNGVTKKIELSYSFRRKVFSKRVIAALALNPSQ